MEHASISEWLIKEHKEEDRLVRLNMAALILGGLALFGAILVVATVHVTFGLNIALNSFILLGFVLLSLFSKKKVVSHVVAEKARP